MTLKLQRKILIVCGLVVATAMVGGCDNVRKKIATAKAAPDEFSVYTRAPLTLPPEYTLRVPEPGAERPGDASPQGQAKRVLTDQSAISRAEQNANVDPQSSAGTVALLRQTGALDADSSIRLLVDKESATMSDDHLSVMERMMTWDENRVRGKALDPEKESQRIREAQALGTPINEGETPVLERKEKGLLEGLFD